VGVFGFSLEENLFHGDSNLLFGICYFVIRGNGFIEIGVEV
jgi:hypothetical protein